YHKHQATRGRTVNVGVARNGLSSRGVSGVLILVSAIGVLACVAAVPFYWANLTGQRLGESAAELRFIEDKIRAPKQSERPGLTPADNIDPIFVVGATAGLAQAGLQELLGSLADEAGMLIVR